jgi:HK97 family phage major capsid protein
VEKLLQLNSKINKKMNIRLELKKATEARAAKEAEYFGLLNDPNNKMTPEFRTQLDGIKSEVELLKADESRWNEAHTIEQKAASVAGATQDNASEKREKQNLWHVGEVMHAVRTGTITGRVKEMHDEASRRGGNGLGSGINIPIDMFQITRTQKRDVQATGAATGTPYVPTQTLSFIDALRNDIVMMNMGATMLSGLTGNINIPRKGAGAAVAAAAENTAATETTPATETVALAPKRVTAFTDVSDQVQFQANEDILALTENDLYAAMLQEVQRQLIHGSGSNGEMTGLLGISGIGSVATATVTYAVIQNIIDAVAGANGITPGKEGWLTNSFMRKTLKQKEEISSSGYKIWANDNTIDGYPVYMTNSVSRVLGTGTNASALIYGGDWSQFIIAQFGSVSLTRNPYTKGKEALTEVIMHAWFDCDARQPAAFAADVAITA